jgi:hypothetical protein
MDNNYHLSIMCKICGKPRGLGSHDKCSKELQKLSEKKYPTKRLTEKSIDYLIKDIERE